MENRHRTTLLISDAASGSATDPTVVPLQGGDALHALTRTLRAYGMAVSVDELDEGWALTIDHPDALDAKAYRVRNARGRGRVAETWPEGVETDEQRLAWLRSVSVADAMETLGVSRRTYYRRLSELETTVQNR